MIVVTTIGGVSGTWVLHLIAFGIVAGCVWRLAQLVVVPVVAAQRHFLRHVATVLEVDVAPHLEPVGDLGVELHVGAVGIVVIALDGALVVQISEAQVVVDTVGGTRDAGIVVLVEASAEGGVLPVVGLASQEVLHHDGCIGIEAHTACVEAEHRLSSLRGLRSGAGPLLLRDAILREVVEVVVVAHGYTAVLAIVSPCAILTIAVGLGLVPVFAVGHILAGTEHVAISGLGIGGEVHAHIDDWLALLTFLSGDDDDTAGCLGTIDSCRGGILQHVDLLDVVGVDLGEATGELHAVEDDERSVVRAIGVERVLTTQLDAGIGLCIGAESDLETRCAAQQVLHGARVLVGNLLGVDLYDRTGKVFLAHRTVTYHHHGLQRL